jgi:DNA polymerase I
MKLPEFNDPDTLFLVDLDCWIHQFFHVGPNFAARNFIAKIEKIVRSRAPARMLVACDNPWPTFRHRLLEGQAREYKGNRSDRGGTERAAVLEQLRLAREYLDKLGIKHTTVEGFESDDIIATAAAWGEEEGLKVVILAVDKDMCQLVNASTVMWDGKEKLWDEAGVFERLKVKPRQVVDYQAMVGDATDNVAGIKNVGPESALKVLEAFGTLDNALASASRGRDDCAFWLANGRVWSALAGARPQAELMKKLVRLRYDVPLKLDTLDDLRVPDLDLNMGDEDG